MSATMVNLRESHSPNPDDLTGLESAVAALIGEPFRFARVTYGDELTLHFGDLRPAKSPKLRGMMYGSYILGVRASAWLLKAGAQPMLVAAGVYLSGLLRNLGTPVTKEQLEAPGAFIQTGARVLEVSPFESKPAQVIGMQLKLSDGTALTVLPIPETGAEEDAEHPDVEVADWELRTPYGLIRVGPGVSWEQKPL